MRRAPSRGRCWKGWVIDKTAPVLAPPNGTPFPVFFFFFVEGEVLIGVGGGFYCIVFGMIINKMNA